MPLAPLPPTFAATRDAARRIGAHVMARARKAVVGRIDLTPTPGGFGTPAFGLDHCVIRLSGELLIVERTGSAASTRSLPVNGATLAELAELAGADLSTTLDVGADTPELGDVDVPIDFDGAALTQIGTWWAMGAQVLDRVLAAQPATAEPSRSRIWPEHFDLGVDLAAPNGKRLNLGASPGDGFHAEPYLYVAPWDAERPGDPAYWNAPFGAVLGYGDVSPVTSAFAISTEFLNDGLRRFG